MPDLTRPAASSAETVAPDIPAILREWGIVLAPNLTLGAPLMTRFLCREWELNKPGDHVLNLHAPTTPFHPWLVSPKDTVRSWYACTIHGRLIPTSCACLFDL